MTAILRKGAAWALLPLLLCCGAADARAGGDGPGALAEVSGYRPALRDGETLDLYVYLSTQQDPFLKQGRLFNATRHPDALVYRNTTKFGWGVAAEPVTINVSLPQSVRQNKSSLHAHVFLCREGASPNPWAPENRHGRCAKPVLARNVCVVYFMCVCVCVCVCARARACAQ